MQLAWPKRVVEENNLQVQVVTLRKLLGPATITTIPGRGYQFTAPLDGAGQPETTKAAIKAASPTTAPPTNLPPELPPLYGRDDDLARLSEMIERHPLVSVIGPGGIGKTRLAQAAAYGARADFADGVWVVELAPLTDPALAISAVAQTLEVQLRAEPNAVDLAETLRARRMLLVLDNCEHLLESVAERCRSPPTRSTVGPRPCHQPRASALARRAGVSPRHPGLAGKYADRRRAPRRCGSAVCGAGAGHGSSVRSD